MKESNLYQLSIKSVIISAVIGTSITTLYLITKESVFMVIGFVHLIPTIPYHFVLLLAMLIRILTTKQRGSKGIQIVFIMLLNIPLALLCASLALNGIDL